MSYDITVHQISQVELQRYVFDLITDPSLSLARAQEIAQDASAQAQILKLYETFDEWRLTEPSPSSPFGLTAAIIAGHLHNYYYVRNECLSFADGASDLFLPLAALGPPEMNSWPHAKHKLIIINYSASGLIPIDRFAGVKDVLANGRVRRAGRGEALYPFSAEAIESYLAALDDANKHGRMLIEAAEVVIPVENKCYSFQGNLRAHFLHNVNRVGKLGTKTREN